MNSIIMSRMTMRFTIPEEVTLVAEAIMVAEGDKEAVVAKAKVIQQGLDGRETDKVSFRGIGRMRRKNAGLRVSASSARVQTTGWSTAQ